MSKTCGCARVWEREREQAATSCNTLQHSLQHTALQHSLQHTATLHNTLQHSLQRTATHTLRTHAAHTLQHYVATQKACNTRLQLQHKEGGRGRGGVVGEKEKKI